MDLLLILTDNVNLFCKETAEVWRFVGYILFVFKIVIPILLIIFGMMDLGKAVVSSKEDEIKKATSALAKRAVAGIVIFFIPTIVTAIWMLVDTETPVDIDGKTIQPWTICRDCVANPIGADCKLWNGESSE